MRERVDGYRCWEEEYTRRLDCSLIFGIDDHLKTQLCPEIRDLLTVVGIPYTCDRSKVPVELLGYGAAKQVQFV